MIASCFTLRAMVKQMICPIFFTPTRTSPVYTPVKGEAFYLPSPGGRV